jgi:hypothetical protein
MGEKSSLNPNLQDPKPADIHPKPDLQPSLMVLLGDKAQVEARFIPFGDSANLDGR